MVDELTRECPPIEVDTSLPAARVIGVLEQLGRERGLPKSIVVDHGPEFISRALDILGVSTRDPARVHPAGQACGERVRREFPQSLPGRVLSDPLVLELDRCAISHRALAPGLTTTSVRTRVSAIDHPRSLSGTFNRRSTTPTDSQPNTLTDSGLGRRPLERRHKQARFRDPDRSLDTFDFDFNKKMNRALVYELVAARFVAQREDALLLGPPGCGKSHLSQAIGRAVIQQGYRVYYREAHTLLEELADATLDGTRKDYLAELAADNICLHPREVLQCFRRPLGIPPECPTPHLKSRLFPNEKIEDEVLKEQRHLIPIASKVVESDSVG